MAEEQRASQPAIDDETHSGASTVAKTVTKPAPPKPKKLPQYKVLLHDDDINDMGHVVLSILKLTQFSLADAEAKMLEAHLTGVSLLLVTHKERAELYQEQFCSFGLTVTIEPE